MYPWSRWTYHHYGHRFNLGKELPTHRYHAYTPHRNPHDRSKFTNNVIEPGNIVSNKRMSQLQTHPLRSYISKNMTRSKHWTVGRLQNYDVNKLC
ncbi:GM16271 [Drosophila sechellia]|uniref:GM16271 n=1 Tax=Drosophila sechellia TaxID=7238 RepID=B4ILL5_DROSE|nr:GM16271 [Drosophila sechellia]